MEAKQGVSSTHPDYSKYLPKWTRCKDVVDGQDAVRGKRETYLPRLKNESDADYSARVGRSDFFNATWRTISGLSGMAFRKPPEVDVPPAILPFLDDINMAGVGLVDMAKDLVEDVLAYGRMGLLVDYPPLAENVVGLSLAASEALGNRPTIQVYEACHVINWKFARIRNSWVLSMVVLQESTNVSEDEFGHTIEPRYRVLDLDGGVYRQRVFKVEDGKDILLDERYPVMNNKFIGYIPFSFVGAGGRADAIDEPPLIDLVDKNLAHYEVESLLRHVLHFTPPVFFISGYQADENTAISIGGTTALIFPDPQAKADFAEIDGDAIPAVERTLDRFERQMAIMGARMIADETAQVETAAGTKIKRAAENGNLSAIVGSVSSAIEWALGVFVEWHGAKGDVAYKINDEFAAQQMTFQEWSAIMALVQGGQLSERDGFDLYKRAELVAPEKTFEEHQAEIQANPAIPAPVKPDVAAAA